MLAALGRHRFVGWRGACFNARVWFRRTDVFGGFNISVARETRAGSRSLDDFAWAAMLGLGNTLYWREGATASTIP